MTSFSRHLVHLVWQVDGLVILEIIESSVCKPIVITRVYHRVCLVCVEPTELKTSQVSFYYCCGNSNLRATIVFV